jgi:hypothetical protein
MVYIIQFKLAFLTPATQNLKGWYMKQSDKTPSSKKEMGSMFWDGSIRYAARRPLSIIPYPDFKV